MHVLSRCDEDMKRRKKSEHEKKNGWMDVVSVKEDINVGMKWTWSAMHFGSAEVSDERT